MSGGSHSRDSGNHGAGNRGSDGQRGRSGGSLPRGQGRPGTGAGKPRGSRRPANKPPRPTVDPARRTAYDILHEVGSQGAYTHVALGQFTRQAELDSRDAAFATELVYGTVRQQLTLDAILELASGRKLAVLDPRVVDVLRLGAYQLLFAATDQYAAVDTSVNLVKSVVGPAPGGLVNAVLRKVSARDLPAWRDQLRTNLDPKQARAALSSHPEWMISALTDALGPRQAGQLDALLEADNEPARPTLVARPGRAQVDDLIEQGATPGRYSPYAAIASTGLLRDLKGLRNGSVAVQDEGSQLVALALANAEVAGEEQHWIDLCAGPGGKLGLLAAIAGQRGLTAAGVELHPHRAKLVDNTARRIPGYAGVVVGDGRQAPIRPGVDRVLLDAPCTGLGVLRRRPEIRWRRSPKDVPGLAALQTELLDAAIDLVRPGGVVGYTTCSPHIAETTMVIAGIRKARGDIEIEDARPLFPGVNDLGDGPYVRLWPHLHGTDGMFFALIRKR